mmetsp:Transcript_37151/g.83220  ORF Transcript_37151/g.83220 Transcript_37151/m.83220 type:complete len:276 (-) Transcript_37151:477-1304(-)
MGFLLAQRASALLPLEVCAVQLLKAGLVREELLQEQVQGAVDHGSHEDVALHKLPEAGRGVVHVAGAEEAGHRAGHHAEQARLHAEGLRVLLVEQGGGHGRPQSAPGPGPDRPDEPPEEPRGLGVAAVLILQGRDRPADGAREHDLDGLAQEAHQVAAHEAALLHLEHLLEDGVDPVLDHLEGLVVHALRVQRAPLPAAVAPRLGTRGRRGGRRGRGPGSRPLRGACGGGCLLGGLVGCGRVGVAAVSLGVEEEHELVGLPQVRVPQQSPQVGAH